MILVAWITLIAFGLISISLLFGTIGNQSIHPAQLFYVALFVILTALSAGVIWGGLFQ